MSLPWQYQRGGMWGRVAIRKKIRVRVGFVMKQNMT